MHLHVGVRVGESATLYCEDSCDRVMWWQNSDLIVKDGQLLENSTERFNISCNCNRYQCELTILNVQIEDSGEYYCFSGFWIDAYFSQVTVICKSSIILQN